MGSLRGLKGTGVAVSEDLTVKERKVKKLIYDHYRTAIVKGHPARLVRDGVFIRGVKYTYEQLKDSKQLAKQGEENAEGRTERESSTQENERITGPLEAEQITGSQGSIKDLRPQLDRQNTSGKETSKRGTAARGREVGSKHSKLDYRTRSGSKSSISSN